MGNLTNSFATTPVNEQDATKVATYNAALQILDSAINGRLAISTTGGTTTLTGTPAAPQAQNLFLDVSGTLASAGIIQIPVAAGTGRNRIYVVKNGTSGAFSLTVRKVGGTGVTVTQGYTALLLYNDSDIVKLFEVNHSTGALATDNTAWANYTPTITSGTGTLTNAVVVGYFKQIGKTTFVRLTGTITTNGTGATDIRITLPAATPNDVTQYIGGTETASTGKALRGAVLPNTSTLIIRYYDFTYPGADGNVLTIEGVYESA